MAGRITKARARAEASGGRGQWKSARRVVSGGRLVPLAEGVAVVNSQAYRRAIKVPGKQA